MDDLIKKLDTGIEALEDFSMFKHLFSEDKAERQLAELREALLQIKLKVKLSKIKEIKHPDNSPIQDGFLSGKPGLVKIRPCSDEYNNKTFIGFYIGDIARGSCISIEDDKIICRWSSYNPGIFVPELNKIIYGYESWWGKISIDDIEKEITDSDIENVWYVQLLKALHTKQEENI